MYNPITLSPAQEAFLQANAPTDAFFASLLQQARRNRGLSARQIEVLDRQMAKRAARQQQPAPDFDSDTLEPGVYEKDGTVYVVQPNKEGTHVYAKRLVEIPGHRLTENGAVADFEFEYDKGAVKTLRPADKMDVERGKALCIRYGRCIRCGRHLSDATSVERGIGPVCIKYFRPVSQGAKPALDAQTQAEIDASEAAMNAAVQAEERRSEEAAYRAKMERDRALQA